MSTLYLTAEGYWKAIRSGESDQQRLEHWATESEGRTGRQKQGDWSAEDWDRPTAQHPQSQSMFQ